MEDKIRILLNKLIYDKLQLNIIEKDIVNSGIKSKEIFNEQNYDIPSNYFFLLNDIYLERLNSSEIKVLENHIENINFSNIILNEDLVEFLTVNLYKLIIPETNESYYSYNGFNEDYLVPFDAIVLGFHYIKFLDNIDNMNSQENIIYDKINYIQEVLAPSKNMKVSVLLFDELVNLYSKKK